MSAFNSFLKPSRGLAALLVLCLLPALGAAAGPASLPGQVPPPGADDTVQLFNPSRGTWYEGRLRDAAPDGEVLHAGRLFRLRGAAGLVQWARDIEVARLAAADAAFEPTAPHREPQAEDVVWVFGREARHSRLATLTPGERFAFQGRVFDSQRDPASGALRIRSTGQSLNRVVRTFQRQSDALVALTLRQEGRDAEDSVTGTPEHPFFVPALEKYVPMGQLRPGDRLLTSEGTPATVVASHTRHEVRPVFNFEVAHHHNYFVASAQQPAGVLVHNTCRVDDVIKETVDAKKGNLTSQHTLSADEALEAGSKWVGPGATEIGKPNSGVYRSADNTRQFRMDDGSIRGAHDPGVPHVHLEKIGPDGNKIVTNNHIPFKD